MKLAALLLAATVLLTAQAKLDPIDDPDQIGNRNVARGVNFYPIDKELALGKSLANDVLRQARVVDDPVIAEFVNRVAQNLARNSDLQMPLTVHVIEGDSLNAFTLPGGIIFVHTGLLENVSTEAQLAGVLAHEIAHAAARHGTRTATRGEVASLSTIPLSMIGGGWAGFGVRQAAQFAIPASLLTFSRGFENEADNLGLQYMYRTGYDPVAYFEVFEKIEALQRRKPGLVDRWFGTHPLTSDRIERAQKRIAANLVPRAEYIISTSEFDAMRARLIEMIRKGSLTRPEETPAEDPQPTLRRRQYI